MNLHLKIILITGSLLFCLLILNMLRKGTVELKYVLTWVLSAFAIMAFSLFPYLAVRISGLLGIAVPSNAIFLICIFFLLVIAFALTIATSRQSCRLRKLSQEFALLKQSLLNEKNNLR